MLGWFHLWRYCADRGNTPEAVEQRLRAGHWTLGIHARKPDGCAELWVNLDAVMDWCVADARLAKLPCGAVATALAGGNARPGHARSGRRGGAHAFTEDAQAVPAAAGDTLDTAGIAALIGCCRRHATNKLTKEPDFPPPVVNVSRRLRRWRRADVLRYLGKA